MEKWKCTLVVVLMVFGIVGRVWGQFGKERVIKGCEVCELRDVQAIDLDDDKDIDVLTASFGKIAWYKNEGRGSFSKQIIILETQNYIESVAVVDLDKDGDQDILFVETFFNYINIPKSVQKIQWLKNVGQLNFSKGGEIVMPNHKHDLKLLALDIDYDGDVDILPSEEDIFYENDGAQNFTPSWLRIYNHYAKLSDINSDGIIDILSSGIILTWQKNNGKGIFSSNRIDTIYLGLLSNPIAGDLDRDGDQDIVVGSLYLDDRESNRLYIYRNEGQERFSNPAIIEVGESVTSLEIADLDSDNYPDIIAALGHFQDRRYRIVWFKNDKNGNFSEPKTIINNIGDDYANLALADIDGDKDIDVISAHRSNELFWHKNDGNGNFLSYSITSPQIQGAISVKGGDVDDDGDSDLVVASFDDNKISLFRNLQKGVFSEPIVIKDNIIGIRGLDMWDIDGDQDMDIASASIFDHKIAWYKNNNEGIFSATTILADNLEGANLIDHADIDGDGLEDIVASGSVADKVVWFRNLGSGDFEPASDIGVNLDSIRIMLVADLDGDIKPDIVVVSTHSPDVIILKNQGKGAFFQQRLELSTLCDKVYLTDIDVDGDHDLFVSSYEYSDKIFFYSNNGKGVFSIDEIKTDSVAQSFLRSFDIDSDGDLDLLYGQTHTHIFWMENENGVIGNSKKFQNIIVPYNISDMVPIDLDLDGDKDLLYISSRTDKIAWYENQSNHPSISGFTFWDENNNHKYDSSEQKILNLPVNLEPTALASYTDAQGQYRFYAPEGKYRISVAPDSCWELSTDSLSYQVLLEKNKAMVRHFGFKPTSSAPKLKVRLNSAPTRCGFEVPFWLSLHNEACLFTQGRYGLVLSKLANLIKAEPAPSQIQGDTLFWDVDQLFGSQTKSVKLLFRIAGTDFLGDTILMRGLAYVKNNAGQLLLANTFDYRSEIRCAYDPNDKLVQPTRIPNYNQNLTLFKERMEYTIRFQNTGTDTAFTIVIRDTLDGNLDLKTFKPIMASHPVETHLGKDGSIEFLFRNILLPPTKTNEPLSHGFVRYQISAKSGLTEQTEIANTAHIYFDYNPPITTNTTENVMVSALPKKGGGQGATGLEAKVYPNPFFDYLQVEIVKNSTNAAPYTFYLQNSQAQVLFSQQLNGVIERIDTGDLPSGLYFYLIKNAQGSVVASGKVVCR